MNLTDLLKRKGVDPKGVLVLRHKPWERELNRRMPWIIIERPDVFNAYQATQNERVERAMTRASHVAAFYGRDPGKAHFVGLYTVKGSKAITQKQFWRIPANIELKSYGMNGFTVDDSARATALLFDLVLTDFYPEWKGKLVIRWPGKELSWFRWADKLKNEMSVLAILDECAFDSQMPEWDELNVAWHDLGVIPTRWKTKLCEWRGIYYVFDVSDGKGYVGSAYGEQNLLGRWRDYAARGHGGNRLLQVRDPVNFRFSILELVKRNMDPADVVRLEAKWKDRLHTRHPMGLNDN